MSKHDDHQHGPGGESHSHDHDHEKMPDIGKELVEHIERREASIASEPPPGQEQPELEDSGSRALGDALRSSFVIVKVLMVILVLVFIGSGFFTVPAHERAFILRFGKPVGAGADQLLGPGAHWSFPSPIDEVVRIPIGDVQTVTSTAGWYATTPEMEAMNQEPPPGPSLNPAADGYTLTSDANIIHVRATLRYRITDPIKYTLNYVNASNVLQNALNNALFYASGRFTADQALRLEVTAFKERIVARVAELVNEQGLGIEIDQADVRSIPPRFIRNAFDEVLRAEMDRRKAISDAQGHANRILATAQGEVTTITNRGRQDQFRMATTIAAEAEGFRNQLPHYRANPELFTSRLKTEALSRILTNAQTKIFLPTRADGKRELRVSIGRDLDINNQGGNNQGQQQQQ